LTKDITCFSALALSPRNAVLLIERAYKRCYEKKRPVHISLPKDFLEQDIGNPVDISSLLRKISRDTPLFPQKKIENTF